MTEYLINLDDDLDRMQNLSKDQILDYVDSNLPKLMECLSNCKTDPAGAVKSVCIMLDHCLPCFDSIVEAEKQMLVSSWPLLEDLFLEIFDNINKQLENQMLDVVEGLLQVLITLVGSIRSCVQFYYNFGTITASDSELFCKSFLPIVLKSLSHCSNSSAIYGAHAETLVEDLSCLFKEVGDVVAKVICFFKDAVQFDFNEREHEVIILKTVAEFFGSICVLSQVLGVRIMTECWKFYTMLTAKYAQNLTPVLSVEDPVTHLANEISSLADMSINQITDAKVAERTVKIASFMLRLLINLLEAGYSKSINKSMGSIVNLLINLQRFSELSCNLCAIEVTPSIQMIDRQLVVGISSIVSILLNNQLFAKFIFEVLEVNECSSAEKEPVSEVLLNAAIICELKTCNPEGRQHWIKKQRSIFKKQLTLLDKCPFALSTISTDHTKSIYEICLSSSISLALTLSTEEFSAFEYELFETFCSSTKTPWPLIFASDLWVCLIKTSSPELCAETVKNLQSSVIMLPDSPQKKFVSTLAQRLMRILPLNHLTSFFNTEMTQIEAKKVESDLNNLLEKPSGKSYEGCLKALELMGTREANPRLLQPLLRLLPLISEGELGEKLGICVISTSIHYLHLMENKHLTAILSQFCTLSSCLLRVKAIEFLSHLAKQKFEVDGDQKTVIRLIAETFNDYLQIFNPVLQQEALATFAEFACLSPHEEIVSLAVMKSTELQSKVASYIQKSCSSTASADKEMKRLSKLNWRQHRDKIIIETKEILPDFSSLNDNDFFSLDDDEEEPQHHSQLSASSAPRSPLITPSQVEGPVDNVSESECSQECGFSPDSQMSIEEEKQNDSEPLVLELNSLVDSLIRNCKKGGLSESDKKKVRVSILKLQNLTNDN